MKKSYKFPKQIPIGGHTYTVELMDSCHTTDVHPSVADTFSDLEEIRIATVTPGGTPRNITVLEESLLHETIHSISEVWSLELQEAQVEGLAQGMLQVLRSLGIKLIEPA